jgi:hypothetical protein
LSVIGDLLIRYWFSAYFKLDLIQRLAVGISKEGVVLAFGDIKPHDEIIIRPSNMSLELTEFIDSGSLILVHGNLLLAAKRLWVMATLGYQEVTALSTR